MTTPARAMRLCDVCGGYDDAPRHVLSLTFASSDAVPSAAFLADIDARYADSGGVSASSVAELMDPTTYVRHMDCCAAHGCPDGICGQVLAAAGNASGDALISALESGVADHLSTPGD